MDSISGESTLITGVSGGFWCTWRTSLSFLQNLSIAGDYCIGQVLDIHSGLLGEPTKRYWTWEGIKLRWPVVIGRNHCKRRLDVHWFASGFQAQARAVRKLYVFTWTNCCNCCLNSAAWSLMTFLYRRNLGDYYLTVEIGTKNSFAQILNKISYSHNMMERRLNG